ncbi:MAG TPA: DMT family transporter [Candidatus Thermoplasmatota archaeon]|nr:DMT family transporter [Candidatus Thermoplasmatota archaeon]
MAGLDRGLPFALLAAFFGGTIPVAGAIALRVAEPWTLTAARFAGAALVLLAVLVALGRARSVVERARADAATIGLAAVALATNYVTFLWGLDLVGPVAAQILFQTAGVFLALWGALFFAERWTTRRLAGFAAAVVGAAIVAWNGRSLGAFATEASGLAGALVIVLSALAWSGYALAQKRLGGAGSLPVLALVLLSGAIMTGAGALVEGVALAPGVETVAVLYLVLATVGLYGSLAVALARGEAATVAATGTLSPAVTVVLTVALGLGGVSVHALAGGALVVAGVAVVALAPRAKPLAEPPRAVEVARR